MKTPLRVLKILGLCAALVLTACNQKRPNQKINSRAVPRGPGQLVQSGGVTCGGNCHWGKFFDIGPGQFEERAKDYGSAAVPWDEIGKVNYQRDGTDTGIWFWGEMILEGGTISSLIGYQSTTASLSLSKNSILAVHIYDSVAVESQGQTPPISSIFTGNQPGWDLQGTVRRNGVQLEADLRFWDSAGEIRLIGTFSGNQSNAMFEGDVYFTNKCSVIATEAGGTCGGTPYPQLQQAITAPGVYLGQFAVDACHFFSCQ